jgi:hypothetical protein
MKYLFITLLFVFISNTSLCQNLTLDQLLPLRLKSLEKVEEFLTAKNWELAKVEDATEESLGYALFAYKKSLHNDRAESFISFIFSSVPNNQMISIHLVKVEKYNSFLARVKALGFKFQESIIEEGQLIKIYRYNNTTIKVTTSFEKLDYSSTKTTYIFLICNSKE